MEKYIRDENSGAILNTNAQEKARINELREKARKDADLEKRVSALEKEIKRLAEYIIHGSKK